jgi:hypothetical protein
MPKSDGLPRVQSPEALRVNRTGVRLLFAGFLFCAFAAIVIRECFNEPYPGPFMPPFKGNGLRMVSPTEASVVLPRMTVLFSDQTTATVSEPVLFADIPSPIIRRMVILMIVPEPKADPNFVEGGTGLKQKLRDWAARKFPSFQIQKSDVFGPVPEDVRRYLAQRLEKVFPGKTPVSLDISLYRYVFPLADFHQRTGSLVRQGIISFHEGT